MKLYNIQVVNQNGITDMESLVGLLWSMCGMCMGSIFVLGCVHYTFRGILYIVLVVVIPTAGC